MGLKNAILRMVNGLYYKANHKAHIYYNNKKYPLFLEVADLAIVSIIANSIYFDIDLCFLI